MISRTAAPWVVPDADRPRPVRVVSVDVDQPLPDLRAERADGDDYARALVFAFRKGVPAGHLEVSMENSVVTGAQLADRLAPMLPDQPHSAGPIAAPTTRAPYISIVVPTVMRRTELLERSVLALAGLDYPGFEVIVVDNRPDDTPGRARTHQQLARHPRVSVVAEPVAGISAARNTGVRHARGEIIAFTDDDAEVDGNWLRAIAHRFVTEPDVDCVTGLVLPAELETPAQIWFERSGGKVAQRYAAASYRNSGAWRGHLLGSWSKRRFAVTTISEDPSQRRLPHRPERGVPVYRAKFGMGVNMAFRTAALRTLGGFDEALGTGTLAGGGEDIEMISRLLYSGRKLTFDPAVVVRHYHRRDYAGVRRQMYAYGTGYTAALTALIRSDPRHLVGLLYLVPEALRLRARRSADRGTGRYPKDLTLAELRGLMAGPFLYARGRLLHGRGKGRGANVAADRTRRSSNGVVTRLVSRTPVGRTACRLP